MFGQFQGQAVSATIKNGKLRAGTELINENVDFVITKNGELILGDGHHFMSNRAKSVIAAGELEIEKGVLKRVSNQSGHYQPSEDVLRTKFLSYLKDLGVDISKATTTTEKIRN